MIWLEAISYIVTILGFPAAIYVIFREERLRRKNEERELHRNITEEYNTFLRMVMENSDLLLMSREAPPEPLTAEQRERMDIIYRILISLFEKAYIILHTDSMSGEAARRWRSWKDYMVDWCAREDFRALLPYLLEGEDDEFSTYILGLAKTAQNAAHSA